MATLKQYTILGIVLFFISCKERPKHNVEPAETPTETVTETVVKEEDSVKEPIPSKNWRALKEALTAKGYKTFDYVDAKTQDTVLMQQYFIVFLKNGPVRNQNEEETVLLQEAHLTHLTRMYHEGYADISGPFGDDGAIRGMTIYNVPTKHKADSLARLDPMVKAGRLTIEVHPWWAAKGTPLR